MTTHPDLSDDPMPMHKSREQSPAEWLADLFEREYCDECGGDADDHTAVPFLGGWFARCDHPISEDDPDPEGEIARRVRRQNDGLPMVTP